MLLSDFCMQPTLDPPSARGYAILEFASNAADACCYALSLPRYKDSLSQFGIK